MLDVSFSQCLVCGDDNASKHFGSICCWACKEFFHRSGHTIEHSVCASGGNCKITKESRNSCRACRYRKCIEVGLNPKLLRDLNSKRTVRVCDAGIPLPDGGSSDEWRSAASEQTSLSTASSADDRTSASYDAQISQTPSLYLNDLPLGVKNLLRCYDPLDLNTLPQYFVSVEKLCDNYSDASGLETIFNIDVPASAAFHRPGVICRRTPLDWAPVRTATVCSLLRSYLRTFLHFIDWTSFIPELAALEAGDKELLLASRSTPCALLLMCHRSAVYKTKGVAISGGDYHPSCTSERANHGLSPIWPIIDRAMEELVDPLSSLDVSDAEYALLKLLCLCVEVPGMSRRGGTIVASMRNKYLGLLSNVIQKSIGKADFSLAVARINRLLLLLPAAERVSQVNSSTLALLSMFNYAGLQGQLT